MKTLLSVLSLLLFVPRTGASSSLKDGVPSSSITIRCTTCPLPFVTISVSGPDRASTVRCPSRHRIGAINSRSDGAGFGYVRAATDGVSGALPSR